MGSDVNDYYRRQFHSHFDLNNNDDADDVSLDDSDNSVNNSNNTDGVFTNNDENDDNLLPSHPSVGLARSLDAQMN